MSLSFFSDVEASARRADRYWTALAKKARLLCEHPSECDSVKVRRAVVWSRIIYAFRDQNRLGSRLLPACDLVRDEESCFDGLHLVDAARAIALWRLNPEANFTFMQGGPDADVRARTDDALELIRTHWREGYSELNALIRGFAWIESECIDNFSDPRSFGLVHLRFSREKGVFEHAIDLVHETAHHALFIENATDRLIENPEALCYSALRNSMRPAIGVYHGTIATGRMLEFAGRVRNSRGVFSAEAELAIQMMTQWQRSNIEEMKRIKLTPNGLVIIAEVENSLLSLNKGNQ